MTTPPEPTPPLPEPDLASRARPRNAYRLIEVAGLLDEVVDVASGQLPRDRVRTAWLRAVAVSKRGEQPPHSLARWASLFADELRSVWRARNTVRWKEWISDGNLDAAAQMAEKLLDLAEAAADADRRRQGERQSP